MSFFLEVTPQTLRFGGMKSIVEDWGFISQSSNRLYEGPCGTLSSPYGTFVLGSSVMANFVLTKMRMRPNWNEADLIQLSGENRVKIVVVTDQRICIYSDYGRLVRNHQDGCGTWDNNCHPQDLAAVVSGNTPKHWEINKTDLF